MSANPGALSGWFPRRSNDETSSDAGSGADRHDEHAASSSQTASGKDDQTPVVVWEAANRMEAEIVAGRLNSENIPTIIRGESLGAIYGLTTGSLAAANVLVPAALAEKALAILESAVEWDEVEQAEPSESDGSGSDANHSRDE